MLLLGQSPNQGADSLLGVGAVGGASNTLDDVFVAPTTRHSDPGIQRQSYSSSAILRHSEGSNSRSVNSLIGNFTNMDQKSFTSPPRESASFVHMQGKVTKAIDAFDPMNNGAPRRSNDVSISGNGLPQSYSSFNNDVKPSNMAGLQYPLQSVAASQVQPKTNPKADLLQLSNEIQNWSIKSSTSNNSMTDSGLNSRPANGQDESMDMFDPLSNENSKDMTQNRQDQIVMDTQSTQNCTGQGARPKTYNNNNYQHNTPPRISVSHQDSLPNQNENGHSVYTNTSFLHTKPSHAGSHPTVSDKDKTPNIAIPVSTKTEDLSGSGDSGDFASKSRSSTESSTSSLVENKLKEMDSIKQDERVRQ